MAQSDQTIQNATFPAVRADLNDNLAALFSQSSGPSAPATTTAYQPWIDTSTTPATWKVRNGNNTDWIVVGTLNTAGASFSVGGTTSISNGGTGATTASGAINALLPVQSGQAGKFLTTDGSVASWAAAYGSSVYEYTSNNTWTKPSGGSFALVSIWGGGGGGARQNYSGGGGGGACVQKLFRLSELPSSVAITIAAGGAARSTNGNGNVGGTSTFGSLLTAYGGGGGQGVVTLPAKGGGGGGSLSAGGVGVHGKGHGLEYQGGKTSDPETVDPGGAFGGGGGAGCYYANSTFYWTDAGGASWGGGGGSANDGDDTVSQAGKSLHGGNGGQGVSALTRDGSFPAGGGSGVNATSGAGGAGYCLIYVW